MSLEFTPGILLTSNSWDASGTSPEITSSAASADSRLLDAYSRAAVAAVEKTTPSPALTIFTGGSPMPGRGCVFCLRFSAAAKSWTSR